MRKATLRDALLSLQPTAMWSYEDEDYDTLDWQSPNLRKPTQLAIEKEMARLEQVWADEEAAAAQLEIDKEAARLSALDKLKTMGLTELEITALIGL